nr:ATP-dependent Clp protease ATP-binding subunit [Salmonella sp. NCTC 7297]
MENFTTNLNQLARVGGIDPLIGREKELERANPGLVSSP